MRKTNQPPKTSLCRYDDKSIFVREHDVCQMMGTVSFTDVVFLDIIGRMPSATERTIIDAVLICLIEHGMSPSAIATRMTYSSAPESLQGAICSGLSAAGSVLLGSLETCAAVLDEIAQADDKDKAATGIVQRHISEKAAIPGFGHPHFRPVDPRTVRLFELIESCGLPGVHVAAAHTLAGAVERQFGKPLVMNASLGMAAALAEIGFPKEIMRGLAIICRSAGLVAHVYEEMRVPAARAIWQATNEAVPYTSDTDKD